jgi:Na+-transporting methylmalonyl-CoA/oxaloacetate decarboxylase gamma subunit
MSQFFQQLIDGTPIEKGVFVMICGMLGVFLVLILFYLLIRLLTRIFPYKIEDD